MADAATISQSTRQYRDDAVRGEAPLLDLIAERVSELHYGAPTSARAAKRAAIRAGSNAHRILADIAANGPSTPDEVARRIGLKPGQVRPRFTTPLLENGWLRDTGTFRTSTEFEGEAYVCALTDAGRAILEGGG
jgi:hypothetical protein